MNQEKIEPTHDRVFADEWRRRKAVPHHLHAAARQMHAWQHGVTMSEQEYDAALEAVTRLNFV